MSVYLILKPVITAALIQWAHPHKNPRTGSICKDANEVCMELICRPCDVISWWSSQRRHTDGAAPRSRTKQSAARKWKQCCVKERFYKCFFYHVTSEEGLHRSKLSGIYCSGNKWGMSSGWRLSEAAACATEANHLRSVLDWLAHTLLPW